MGSPFALNRSALRPILGADVFISGPLWNAHCHASQRAPCAAPSWRSVDFARLAQRLAHVAAREAGSASPIEDNLLAPGQQVDRLGQSAHGLRRDDDRA